MTFENLFFAKKKQVVVKPYSLALRISSPIAHTFGFQTTRVPNFLYGFTESTIDKIPTITGTSAPTDLRICTFPIPAGTEFVYIKMGAPTIFSSSSLRINPGSNAAMIKEILYWETLPVANFSMNQLSALSAVPKRLFPLCRDLTNMFFSCGGFNQELPWDTSLVTNMGGVFQSATIFNQLLEWDCSNVINMADFLNGAQRYDKPINLNTSNVTSFQGFLQSASDFSQPLNINTSNATNLTGLLRGCSKFNRQLNHLNIAKVTTIVNMLYGCTSFNQDLSSMIFKSTVTRNGYDTSTPAWIPANKPKFTAI